MALSPSEFEALYRAHAPEILGYLCRRSAGHDAQDLLAETFLIAWRRRDDLPGPTQRRAWLFGTARRLLLASGRGGLAVVLTDSVDTWSGPEPSGTEADDPTSQIVRTALAALPETDRELLTMTVWEGLQVVEAARVLGLTASAARVRLHRARVRLAADPRIADLILPSGAGQRAGARAGGDQVCANPL